MFRWLFPTKPTPPRSIDECRLDTAIQKHLSVADEVSSAIKDTIRGERDRLRLAEEALKISEQERRR